MFIAIHPPTSIGGGFLAHGVLNKEFHIRMVIIIKHACNTTNFDTIKQLFLSNTHDLACRKLDTLLNEVF